MQLSYGRALWAAGVGALLALQTVPVAALPELNSGPIASTPANCEIHLAVANPSPGDVNVPRSLVMSGTAFDLTSPEGNGISQIQAFLGARSQGGTFIGNGAFTATGIPGQWSMTATMPPNISGGQDLFVYGLSSVSGQEAIVSIPFVIAGTTTNVEVSDVAQSFCPSVMPPPASPTAVPSVQPTTPPAPTVAPTVAPTIAPILPTPTPQPAPVAPPIVGGPTAVQLNITAPAAPPLTYEPNMLEAPVGSQVTLMFTNDSFLQHNWHVFNGQDSSAPTLAATQIIGGPGATDSVSFTAPMQPGNYFFWCDVHTSLMTGTLVVDGMSQ